MCVCVRVCVHQSPIKTAKLHYLQCNLIANLDSIFHLEASFFQHICARVCICACVHTFMRGHHKDINKQGNKNGQHYSNLNWHI